MHVYLQGPNGEEIELRVTDTDPVDGTKVAHFPNDRPLPESLGWEWWIRIDPT